LQVLPACITIADVQQRSAPLIYVNPAFVKVTGFSKEECEGRNCRFLQGPETEPEAVEMIRQAIRGGTGLRVQLTNYKKDGARFTNLLALKPVFEAEAAPSSSSAADLHQVISPTTHPANRRFRYMLGVQFEVSAAATMLCAHWQLHAR
jgi:PAS domain S-box-containing protein